MYVVKKKIKNKKMPHEVVAGAIDSSVFGVKADVLCAIDFADSSVGLATRHVGH